MSKRALFIIILTIISARTYSQNDPRKIEKIPELEWEIKKDLIYDITIRETSPDSFLLFGNKYLKTDSTNFNNELFPYKKCRMVLHKIDTDLYQMKLLCSDYPVSNGLLFKKCFGRSFEYSAGPCGSSDSIEQDHGGNYDLFFRLIIRPIFYYISDDKSLIFNVPKFEESLGTAGLRDYNALVFDSIGGLWGYNHLKLNDIDKTSGKIIFHFSGNLWDKSVLIVAPVETPVPGKDPYNTVMYFNYDSHLDYSLTDKRVIHFDSVVSIYSKGKINVIRQLAINVDMIR